MQPVSKQRLGKHASIIERLCFQYGLPRDRCYAVMPLTPLSSREAVFSAWSVPRSYLKTIDVTENRHIIFFYLSFT
jgi:hypothetical protein